MTDRDERDKWTHGWGARVAVVLGWVFVSFGLLIAVVWVSIVVSEEPAENAVGWVIIAGVPTLLGVWLIRRGRRNRSVKDSTSSPESDSANVGSRRIRTVLVALVSVLILGGITLLFASAEAYLGPENGQWFADLPGFLQSVIVLVLILGLLTFPYLILSGFFPKSSKNNLRLGSGGPIAYRFETAAVWFSEHQTLLWLLYVGYTLALYTTAAVFINLSA